MPPLRFRGLNACLAVVPMLVFALSGCMPHSATDGGIGPLSIPAVGQTRILSRQVGDKTPDSLHWKWSLIAASNWTAAAGSDLKLALSQPYPLNDPNHIHGTNVWECDLTATRTKQDPNTVRWNAVLHGSNGSTAKIEGSAPLSQDIDSTVRILVDKDTIQGLPATVSLANIGGKELVLSLPR